MHEHAAIVRFLNKIGEHLLGDFEVRDDAIFHGLDSHHVAGSPAKHVFGFAADSDDFSSGFVDGYDGRLVDDDALAGGKDQRVRSAKVDGEVGGK
jgi:hypothetical protein